MVQQVSREGALRWGLVVSLAVLAGCGAPATQAPVQAPLNHKAEAFVPPGAAVQHVDIRPSGRHVLGTYDSYRGYTYGQPTSYAAAGAYPTLATQVNGTSSLVVSNPQAKTAVTSTAQIDGTIGALSRGGGYAAFANATNLGVYDLNTQLIQNYPQLSTANIVTYDVDGLGNIAYIDGRNQVHVFDSRTGQDYIVPVATRNNLFLNGVSLSGDGLYVTTSDGANIFLTSLLSGNQYTVPFVGEAYGGAGLADGGAFQLSPYGDQLLYSDVNANLKAVDLRTGFTDNLPLLNSGGTAWDATFLGGDAANIIYTTRNGQVQTYNRVTNLIDTMPIQNRINETVDSILGFGTGGLWH